MMSGSTPAPPASSSVLPVDCLKASEPILLVKLPVRQHATATQHRCAFGSNAEHIAGVAGREARGVQGRLELAESVLDAEERKFIPKSFRVNYMPAQGHRLLSVNTSGASPSTAAMQGVCTQVGACIADMDDPAYMAHQVRLREQRRQAKNQRPTTALLLGSELRRVKHDALRRAAASATAEAARERVKAAAAAPAAPANDGMEELRMNRASNTVMGLFTVFPYWSASKAVDMLPLSRTREDVKIELQNYGKYVNHGKYQGCYMLKSDYHTVHTRQVLEKQHQADEEAAALGEA